MPESNNASVQARDAAKCKNVNKIARVAGGRIPPLSVL
ncbi:hypothetical protein GS11_2908 [Mycobacterium tuberculosis variant bovis BCG]|nr:hypothetical protein BCGT_2610 [Mycobacterium tuberculosis variant bovis BCG str. ATCC 35743]AKO25834.1 hypothetical protein GS11_2908 [Mycobacterium tuberculosis variant bovis BCG]